jgi:hypothetical protein
MILSPYNSPDAKVGDLPCGVVLPMLRIDYTYESDNDLISRETNHTPNTQRFREGIPTIIMTGS